MVILIFLDDSEIAMFWGVESGLLSHQNCNFSKSVLYLHHGQDQEESDDDDVQQVLSSFVLSDEFEDDPRQAC